MRVIKIEKDACPACLKVGAFLDNSEVAYSSLNIQGENEEQAEQARNYLGELSLFTVPVTVLVDYNGNIIEYAQGMDVAKLSELVSFVK